MDILLLETREETAVLLEMEELKQWRLQTQVLKETSQLSRGSLGCWSYMLGQTSFNSIAQVPSGDTDAKKMALFTSRWAEKLSTHNPLTSPLRSERHAVQLGPAVICFSVLQTDNLP